MAPVTKHAKAPSATYQIRLPVALLQRIDAIVKIKGFNSRADLIRQACRDYCQMLEGTHEK